MSITFPTTDLKVPSGLTAIPNKFKRPGFGSLYGFDASGGGGGDGFRIDVILTENGIFVRSGDAVGTIAYGTDTEDIYVYDGTTWQIYNNS